MRASFVRSGFAWEKSQVIYNFFWPADADSQVNEMPARDATLISPTRFGVYCCGIWGRVIAAKKNLWIGTACNKRNFPNYNRSINHWIKWLIDCAQSILTRQGDGNSRHQ